MSGNKKLRITMSILKVDDSRVVITELDDGRWEVDFGHAVEVYDDLKDAIIQADLDVRLTEIVAGVTS